MLKSFEIIIALRYLRSRKKEGFISIASAFSLIGIIIGVATLIIVMSVMNGYHVALRDRILGINGHITISAANADYISNYQELASKILAIPDVKHSYPVQISQAMVVHDSASSGIMVRGFDKRDIPNKKLLVQSISQESLENFGGSNIIIGKALARKIGAVVGDEIKIIAPEFSTTILGSIPRIKTFKIVGLFDVGMYEYNATTVLMPIEMAKTFFKFYNGVSNIEVLVQNPEKTALIKQQIASLAAEELTMYDWDKINGNLFDALAVERTVMFLILTLIITVAVFNIISSLVMMVKEKARNIAILRTFGMSQTSILKIFIMTGSIIGIVGTFLGTMLGVIIAKNIESIRVFLQSLTGITLFDPVIYFLTKLPSSLEYSDVWLIVSISLLLSFFATIYPAWKASRLMPAEILRYE